MLATGSQEFSSEDYPFHLTRNLVCLSLLWQSRMASTSYSMSLPIVIGGGGNSSLPRNGLGTAGFSREMWNTGWIL